MESKKFYWLKLKKDFFKRHDIRIIQKMPNGEQIILFYLKLMLESIDHEGELRFSKELPYTSDMLSTIMDTDVGIVETSLEVLEKFGLLKIKKDKTISIDMVKSMLGFETEFARQKRLWREQKGQSQDNVKTMSKTKSRQCQDEVRQEIEKEIEIEIEKELEVKRNIKEKTPTRFTPPSLEEVKAYCEERRNKVDPEKWFDHYSANGWKVGKNPMKDWKASVRYWERDAKPEPQKYENPFDKYIFGEDSE